MNRREVIKSTMLVTGGVLSSSLVSFTPFKESNQQQCYAPLRLDIGDLETYIINDGVVRLPSIQPIFAPDVDKEKLTTELKRLHISENKFEGSLNVLLIKNEGKLILLDTGAGGKFGENAGNLIGGLKSIDIEASDITDIIITHGHIDHIGGILDQQDNFVFPSAQYHLAEKEYEFWMSEQDSSINDQGVLLAQKVFSKIEDKLHLFQYGTVLFSCLKTELAEGHTKGHTIFNIFSGEKSVKHIVDTFHSPFLVSKPEWGTAWDTDFDQAVKTRLRIIKEGTDNGTLFLSCHLPWPSLGYIDKVNGESQWTIIPYVDPTRITV